jgi:PKD repeat protein
VSGSATVVPVRAEVDDLWAGAAGTTPTPGQLINAAPTAAVTSTVDALTVAVDGSGSGDPDGWLVSHVWDFGEGSTASGVSASHTYAAAGTYPVTLTVTDDKGATASDTRSVTVRPANTAPTAAFTTATSGLTAALSGTGSADPDGTLVSYAWDFGDGGTGAGVTASHTYASAGTYTVTLTVTDDRGATATSTQSVAVTGTVTPPLAADAFERTSASGFGTADTGGAWTISGGAANATVAGGVGRLSVPTKGGSVSAYLNSVSALDTAVQFRTRLEAAPTGGGSYVYGVARHVGSTDYRMGVRFTSTGAVTAQLSKVVNGVETVLRTSAVEGLNYTPGTWLTIRFDVSGEGTTTLAGKVWADGAMEPTGWQVTTTDATVELQRAGGIGVRAYVSASAVTVPVRTEVDDLWAGAAGLTPAG